LKIENCKLQIGDVRLRVVRGRFLARYRYVRLRWRLLAAVIDVTGYALFWAAQRVARCVSWLGGRRSLSSGIRKGTGPFSAVTGTEMGTGRSYWRSDEAAAARQTMDLSPFLGRGEPKSILVIQLDHLGDAVLSLGMLHVLRREHPGAAIEVLCAPCSQELFSACADVDAVHVLDATRFCHKRLRAWRWLAALVSAGWKLRKRRFDLAIDVRGEAPHAMLMFLAAAKRRLGWRCGGAGFLLTDSPAYEPGRHEVLSRLAVVRALSIEATEEDVSPVFVPADDARQRVRAMLHNTREAERREKRAAKRGLGAREAGARRLVVLHVGSGMPAKRWPAERWQELSARLVFEHGACVALVGGDEDRQAAAAVVGPYALEGVADFTGRLTVPELAAILSEADVVVGSDSAPAHLAAAVGTPVVALFSGTNQQAQWRPWGPEVRVVHRPTACWPCHRRECPLAGHPCMRGITVEEVLGVVGTLRVPSTAASQRCVDQQSIRTEPTLSRR
jgi:lipopolysaccharide heptosyltransferase II